MDRFGLIGYPISHSESPALFRKAYGGKWEYDLIEERDFGAARDRFIKGPYKAVNVTAPFKKQAVLAADILSGEVKAIGAANILVKTEEGIAAHNSDYLALLRLLPRSNGGKAAVIGLGGAGLAAAQAVRTLGYEVECRHHDEIAKGLAADLIIYTLPCAVDGCRRLECGILVEANYKNPCLNGHKGYISGREWLRCQALEGYTLMTGEEPRRDF